MSLRALTWAFDLEIEGMNSTLKLVLITLANYADEDNKTFPRQNTIAAKTLLSRQTVCKALGQLEDLGIISMLQRKHNTGAFRSSLYELLIPRAGTRVNEDDTTPRPSPVSSNATRRVADNDNGCQANRQGLSATTTEVVADADTFNRKLEPPLQPSKDTKRKRGAAGPWPEDAFAQFWALFPRKDGRKNASAIFDRISAAGEVEFPALMEGLKFYLNKDDFREWCWATTWLNGDRWEDRPVQKKGGYGKPRRTVAI